MTQGATDRQHKKEKASRARRNSLVSQNSSGSVPSRDSTPAPGSGQAHGNLLAPAVSSHARSGSFRTKGQDQKDSELRSNMPRRNSMPTVAHHLLAVPDGENGATESKGTRMQRVRSFKTTSKGVVNRGDSFKKKSSHSLMSTGAVNDTERSRRRQASSKGSRHSNNSNSNVPQYFKVIILGDKGVGKSTLTRQFLTSDYTAFEGADAGEITVQVQLNGEESTIEFLDPPSRMVPVEMLQVDAFVVVFSLTDHPSFEASKGIVRYLRVDYGTDRAIIIVGNKTDLVRKRKVEGDDARMCATTFDCKYIETSAALNHHVDELLVGCLSQIRLKLNINFIPQPPIDNKKAEKNKRKKGVRGLFSIFFRKSSRKSVSCDNLYTL